MTFAATQAQAQALIDSLQGAQPDSLALARLVSPAAYVEPQLLRRLRLRLLPSVDVGAEADLWFGDLVHSRGVDSIVLDKDVASLLRAELKQQPFLLMRILNEIEAAHSYLPETLRLEELLLRLVLEEADAARIQNALEPAVRTLYAGGDAARNLAHWVLRVLPGAGSEQF